MKHIINASKSGELSGKIGLLFNTLILGDPRIKNLDRDIIKMKLRIKERESVKTWYLNSNFDNFHSSIDVFNYDHELKLINIDRKSDWEDEYIFIEINQSNKNTAFLKYLNVVFTELDLLQYSQEKIIKDFTKFSLDQELFNFFKTIESCKSDNYDDSNKIDPILLGIEVSENVYKKIKIINNFVNFIELKSNKKLNKKLIEAFLLEYEDEDKQKEKKEIILKEKKLYKLREKNESLENLNKALRDDKLIKLRDEKVEKTKRNSTLFTRLSSFFI